jgi:CHRD domain
MTKRRVLRIGVVAAVVATAAATLGLLAGPSGAQSGSPEGPLFATLLGFNEVGSDGHLGGGDLDGSGSANVLIDGGTVCFGISVTGIDMPTAAHIHLAFRGTPGPIVVGLTAPSTGDPGASSGCVAADPALLQDILQNPAEYYINVHTGTFPAGALRGQLFRHIR